MYYFNAIFFFLFYFYYNMLDDVIYGGYVGFRGPIVILRLLRCSYSLKSPPFGVGDGFGGQQQSTTTLCHGFDGAGESLQYLLEERGVGLDKGGGALSGIHASWDGLWSWRRCWMRGLDLVVLY